MPAVNFLFKRNVTNRRCCKYDASHVLDLRELEPSVASACAWADFTTVNVATWWSSNTVGRVIDISGSEISARTTENDWNASSAFQSFDFASLMQRGLYLMLARHLNKKPTCIWSNLHLSLAICTADTPCETILHHSRHLVTSQSGPSGSAREIPGLSRRLSGRVTPGLIQTCLYKAVMHCLTSESPAFAE